MITRNLLFASISAGSAILMAFVFFLAARVLGSDAFGIFSYALALATIGEALMDMGVHQLTIREVARTPEARFALFRQQLGLKSMTGIVMLIVVLGVSATLDSNPSTIVVVIVMLVSAVLRSFLLTVRGGLLGLEEFATDTALVVGDRVILTVVCTAALFAGVGVLGLSLVFLATRLVTVTAALVVARPHLGLPDWRYEPTEWLALQQQALPLGAFVMVLTIYNYVDTVMLKALTTEAETGMYNVGYRIYEGAAYGAAVIASVLTPRLSHLWKTNPTAHRGLARRGLGAAVGVAALLGAGLYVWAPLWMSLVSAEYVDASDVLKTLAFGLPFVFAIWILQAIAIATLRDRLLVKAALVGLVANIALNLWLIPLTGRNGAAVATVIGEGLTLCILAAGVWTTMTDRVEASDR